MRGGRALDDAYCPAAIAGPREKMDLTFTIERNEETARKVSTGDLSHAEAVLAATSTSTPAPRSPS